MSPVNIIVSNPERLERIKEKIKEGGKNKLQILADFDRTLSKYFAGDKKAPSLIAVLREQRYLTSDYPDKAQALADKYYPIEIDPLISNEEKKEAMEEWWNAHFELLLKSNLNLKDVKKAMESSGIELREGVDEFLNKVNDNNIPLVIMSANGLGKESIEYFLDNINQLKDNVYIISNAFVWGNDGKAIDVKRPIVHNFNKDETLLQNYPFFGEIKEKKNIILLGDSLGDIDMARGFDHDNILRIGFLNDNIKENLDRYEQAYDLLILHDGSFDAVNEVLREIIG